MGFYSVKPGESRKNLFWWLLFPFFFLTISHLLPSLHRWGKKSSITEYAPNSGSYSRLMSLIYMLQHQLSCFSKFLLFIKGPSSEFLHYPPTYNQRQEPNLFSILGKSTAAVELDSQKKVCKQCRELTFLCTCDFKKDLIFIAGFSTSYYSAITVQPFHQNQHSTKLFPPYSAQFTYMTFILHWLISMQTILYDGWEYWFLLCSSPCFRISRLLQKVLQHSLSNCWSLLK